MKKFEYLTMTLTLWSDIENTLNILGDEGWELVSILQNSSSQSYRFVLKREK